MAERNDTVLPREAIGSLRVILRAVLFVLMCGIETVPAIAQQTQQQTQLNQASVAISTEAIELGDSIIYQITLDGVSIADPPPLPASDDYAATFLGGHDESSRSVMTINGKTTETSYLRYIMQWKVTPTRTGVITVPAFTFDVGGQSLKAPRARFTVTEGVANPNFKLTLEPQKTEGFVGEPIHFRLILELGGNAKSASFSGSDGGKRYDVAALDPRPIQSRARAPQTGDAYVVIPFLNGQAVAARSQVTDGGRTIPAIVMDLAVTPRESGKIEIGPYRVVIDEIVGQRQRSPFEFPFDDMARTKRSVVTSNTVALEVRPLPSDGRPADFGGLVGVYSLDATSGNTEANVGDPVPLTVTITGPEPLDGVKPPDLESQPAFAAGFKAAPEGWERSDAAGAAIAPGQRTFATTVRPKSANVQEIPPIRLPYFDTKTGSYSAAASKPIPLKVRPSREITAADALRPGGIGIPLPAGAPASLSNAIAGVAANTESIDALRNQRVSFLAFAASPPGLVLALAPPIALVGAILASRHRRSQSQAVLLRRAGIARARAELKTASSPEDTIRVVRAALGPFLGIAPEAIAASDPTSSRLPALAAKRASALLSRLESISFDSAALNSAQIRQDAVELLDELSKACESI